MRTKHRTSATPGLIWRSGVWHIDKRVRKHRLCESTGTSIEADAGLILARRVDETRRALLLGERKRRTFEQAAEKYLEVAHKKSLKDDIQHLDNSLIPELGKIDIATINMEHPAIARMIRKRRAAGVKTSTINHDLITLRRILNLAATEWFDHGMTWLAAAPKIKLLPVHDAREPYPLTWQEQVRLFAELPPGLQRMSLFAVNAGPRTNSELCGLRWDWEVQGISDGVVFHIPRSVAKTGHARLLIGNRIARAVVDELRGTHPEYVFTYDGHRYYAMMTSAWRKARVRAGLPHLRCYDLRHTYGHRLRYAGATEEDRSALLGHDAKRSMTTHYSAPSIIRLVKVTNSILDIDTRSADIVAVGRFHNGSSPASVPQAIAKRSN